MTKKVMGLIAALAAVVGLIGAISIVSADVSSVTVTDGTVESGANVTVSLNADAVADDGTANAGANDGLGAWTVDVGYVDTELTYVSCTSVAGGLCSNPSSGVVRFTGASVDGLVGSPIELGTMTFTAIAANGTTSTLTPTLTTIADPEGTDDTSVTANNGTITIAQATPTPSPTPSPSPAPATATPTPTASPAALPPTGGTSSDGSGSSIAWVLGALGLAVLAGGVWAVSRTRRHSV